MTISFYLLGILIAGMIWLLALNVGRIAKAIIAVSASVFVTVIYLLISPVFLGESSANAPFYDTSPWKEIILFGLMIFGMAARTLSLAIEQRRRAKGKPHALDIDVWDFVYPFLVSFITFGAVMSQIGSSALSLTSMVFAFQNGFFWQTLMKQSK